jgi:hypothetical protein
MKCPIARPFAIAALAAACTACGAALDRGPTIDPKELLARGDYTAARLAAEARGGDEPSDRAVIALSRIAEHPDREAAASSVKALTKGGARELALRAAVEMLALYTSAPDCADDERALLAAEIALGATGLGPIAAAPNPAGAKGALEFGLAVSIIERLKLGLAGSGELETARVLAIWNGCFALLGGSMKGATDLDAWLLIANLGGLAAMIADAAPTSDLARAMLASAVTAIEANPAVIVAVRCDLSSPFDALRVALTHERDLLGRLERTAAPALGCTLGTYAPRPQG